MKRLSVLLSFVILAFTAETNAQQMERALQAKKGELTVCYFENAPYAYIGKNGKLAGIEIDILNAFVDWAKTEKGMELELNYKGFQEFEGFFNEMSVSPVNTIGLGSVTISEEREQQVKFSAPYLKNVSVLITDGTVPTARNEKSLLSLIKDLKPVTIKGSIHQNYLDNLYKAAGTSVSYSYVYDAEMIPKKIKESGKYFGYIDVISFWKYLKENNHYIKMHSIANKEDEFFGFVLPKTTDWDLLINEFFESGFGFTSTKEYHKILEKHLSFEIIERVEID